MQMGTAVIILILVAGLVILARFFKGHPGSKTDSHGEPPDRDFAAAVAAATTRPVQQLASETDIAMRPRPDVAPAVQAVVAANNAFAFDLFHRLNRNKAGANLFFSPFSIGSVMTMSIEGARGETAEEMGRVLRYPQTARNQGTDAAPRPWRTELIHAAMAELNNTLNANGDPEATAATRQQLVGMRKHLQDVNREVDRIAELGDWDKYRTAKGNLDTLACDINILAATIDRYELRVANALWGEQSCPFNPDYVNTVATHYDTGGIFNVDFRNDFSGARQRINHWTAEQTHQRIKDIIPEMLPAQAQLQRLILTNAIYFKGAWVTPFDGDSTQDRPFMLTSGATVTAPIMRADGMEVARYAAFNHDGSYFDTPRNWPAAPRRLPSPEREAANHALLYPDAGGFAMVELPYNGGLMSMVVIAPNSPDGLDAIEQRLSAERLDGWCSKLIRRDTNVNLPKFKLETAYPLADTLTAMGMKRAFTNPREPGGADFTAMIASADPDDWFCIGQVLHKAFVEVNEQGTEAAAATAEMMLGGMPPFTPTFNADRPFLFMIRAMPTGAVLFLGRITDPTAR